MNDKSRLLYERPVSSSEERPKAFDWRDFGVVTPVKNQGGCGSCWAHASVETIESQAAVNTGKLVELS